MWGQRDFDPLKLSIVRKHDGARRNLSSVLEQLLMLWLRCDPMCMDNDHTTTES